MVDLIENDWMIEEKDIKYLSTFELKRIQRTLS